MVLGPLREKYGSLREPIYGEFRKAKIESLCNRLGVQFTDNEQHSQEMWAEIGERLALEQPEFQRPKSRGRKRLYETKEADLAAKVAVEKEKSKESDREILEGWIRDKKIMERDIQTLLSQLSRGRIELERLKFWGGNEDAYSIFEVKW